MTRPFLLDTHLLLWWLNDDPCLPEEVVSQVQTENVETYISQVSLWEMAIPGVVAPPGTRRTTSQ